MPLSSRGSEIGFYVQIIFRSMDCANGSCRFRSGPIVFPESMGLLRFIAGITERWKVYEKGLVRKV